VNLPASVLAAMSAINPDQDKLTALRDFIREMRDLELEISDLESRLKDKNSRLKVLQREELPTLFTDAGVDKLGLEAEGNLPAYDATAKPYYKASIAADWPLERQAAGFNWLIENGHGDVVKTVITIEFGRGEISEAAKLKTLLLQKKITYSEKLGVPWNTLTKLVKSLIEDRGTLPPLDLLGADVGRIVKLTERKS
jgi:hypothetical protein